MEMLGLPPLASINMISIRNLWGKVRGFDERTVKGRSFGVTTILINTNLKESFDGHIDFVLDGHLCALGLREVSVWPLLLAC